MRIRPGDSVPLKKHGSKPEESAPRFDPARALAAGYGPLVEPEEPVELDLGAAVVVEDWGDVEPDHEAGADREPAVLPWSSKVAAFHEMPDIRRRLLQGESRKVIAQELGCNPRTVSKLIVQYLALEGIPLDPGITRRIRSERKRQARDAFKEWTRKRDAAEKRYVQQHTQRVVKREAALGLDPSTTLSNTQRRKVERYAQGCF